MKHWIVLAAFVVSACAGYGQKEPPPKASPVEDRILRVATFRDPTQEEDKVRDLYNSFLEARQEVGQDRVDFARFSQLVASQVRAIQAKGGKDVAFRVAVQDGKVAFTARAMRGADDGD